MVRQRPRRSALSAPQNFISESLPRRLYRTHRWTLWILVAVFGGAGALVAVPRVDAILPRPEAAPPNRSADVPVQDLVQREQDLVASLKRLDALGEPSTRSPEAKEAEPPAPEPAPRDSASRSAAAQERDETTASVLPTPPTLETAKAEPRRTDAVPGTVPGIERADRYLGRGQYTIARYLYEEAYRAGEVQGALGMAKSYDGAYLKAIGLQAKGDPQRARIWYRRAAELGDRARKSAP